MTDLLTVALSMGQSTNERGDGDSRDAVHASAGFTVHKGAGAKSAVAIASQGLGCDLGARARGRVFAPMPGVLGHRTRGTSRLIGLPGLGFAVQWLVATGSGAERTGPSGRGERPPDGEFTGQTLGVVVQRLLLGRCYSVRGKTERRGKIIIGRKGQALMSRSRYN